jgi:proteasome component ECM29
MPYLLRSQEAALLFPANIQVIFDLLFGTGGNSNFKLRTLSVQFIHSVVEQCPDVRVNSCGAVLLSALNRLVSGKVKDATDQEEQTNAEREAAAKLRASCYVAIGKLGLKMPQLVNKDITIIQVLYTYL